MDPNKTEQPGTGAAGRVRGTACEKQPAGETAPLMGWGGASQRRPRGTSRIHPAGMERATTDPNKHAALLAPVSPSRRL